MTFPIFIGHSKLLSPAHFFPLVLPPPGQHNSFSFRSPHYQAQVNSHCIVKKQSPCRSTKSVPATNDADNGGEIEYVDVVGIGSRNKAVLDFCLNSPLLSPALRFWNVVGVDSTKVQLQERFSSQDIIPRIVEAPSVLQSCSKAVIIVVSAGYGPHDIEALNIIPISQSLNGMAVGIIMKPFSFEGRRRQEEVDALVEKLQKQGSFYIVIDTDALLEKDMLTLEEALKTSNNAVLMAMNAISILISEKHTKFLDIAHNGHKELKTSEIREVLGRERVAKIAFGAGRDIKTSVSRAIYDCPFLSTGVKESDGPIVCTLASSQTDFQNDPGSIFSTIRLTLNCKQDIIVSILHQPSVEPNLIVTTILTFGYSGQQSNQKNGLFYRLAQHFPFIFNILKKSNLQAPEQKEWYTTEGPHLSETISLHNDEVHNKSLNCVPQVYTSDSRESEQLLNNSQDELPFLRDYVSNNEQGVAPGTEKLLTRYRLVPDDQKANEWAIERDVDGETTPLLLISLSICRLPVGVKHMENSIKFPVHTKHQSNLKTTNYGGAQSYSNPSASWNRVSDVSPEVTASNGSSSSKRLGYVGDSNKQGVISSRASSMLEAERDSERKWSPLVEMTYRGGTYRGRSQGGLPEGKVFHYCVEGAEKSSLGVLDFCNMCMQGRLSLGDGSIYEGTWRYGKMSGIGTFYYNNGDVFQGSWRDDAKHGKGWYYFHTGDRWFANFWKGKANGEGRFYSEHGDVLFGQFKDGWRHGSFFCISVDGERFHEVWEEGILVSREELDPDAGADAVSG